MNLPAWDEAQVSSRVKRFAFHAAVALLLLAGCSPDRLPYAGRPVVPTTGASNASGKTASVKSALILPTLPAVQDSTSGISRRADLHTYQPDRVSRSTITPSKKAIICFRSPSSSTSSRRQFYGATWRRLATAPMRCCPARCSTSSRWTAPTISGMWAMV